MLVPVGQASKVTAEDVSIDSGSKHILSLNDNATPSPAFLLHTWNLFSRAIPILSFMFDFMFTLLTAENEERAITTKAAMPFCCRAIFAAPTFSGCTAARRRVWGTVHSGCGLMPSRDPASRWMWTTKQRHTLKKNTL